MYQSVLQAFGLQEKMLQVAPIGNGLINKTWKVSAKGSDYILQRINEEVFDSPSDIAYNIRLVADYLRNHHPEYKFSSPLLSSSGEDIIYLDGEGYFRVFPFIDGARTIDIVETPGQAYEAARQFGKFARLLQGMDTGNMRITIPSFHDLSVRYRQFVAAIENGNYQRIIESCDLISTLLAFSDMVVEYEKIRTSSEFIVRVTHHDTKISNVLFDAHCNGLCVIDLDTVMPGYFISDVGDMMRTYLSPVSEEERDFEKINVRDDFYKAIVNGYFSEMRDGLTTAEKECFFYAGKFMVYMQALRFLTDYLNDDVYYGERYPGHNLVRAGNQTQLLRRLLEKETALVKYDPS